MINLRNLRLLPGSIHLIISQMTAWDQFLRLSYVPMACFSQWFSWLAFLRLLRRNLGNHKVRERFQKIVEFYILWVAVNPDEFTRHARLLKPNLTHITLQFRSSFQVHLRIPSPDSVSPEIPIMSIFSRSSQSQDVDRALLKACQPITWLFLQQLTE